MSALPFANFETSFASAIGDECLPLKEALIDEISFEILQNFASYFPQWLSKFWCFEIALLEQEKRADFLFCISDTAQCSRYFDIEFAKQFPYKSATSSFLPGILSFSKSWCEAKPALFTTLVNIWFEYDFARIEADDLQPNFFYAPRKGTHPLVAVAASETIINVISKTSLHKETWAHFLHCYSVVPRGGWASQIGRMFARNDNSLRLFIQEIPMFEIEIYLEKIRYPHRHDETFTSLLHNCYQLADQVDLDIDITNKTEDTIGLECSFNQMQGALLFLDYLYTNRLCTKEKYIALTHFLNNLHETNIGKLCPFFSHFKIVYHPKKPIKTKAYIGFADPESAAKIIRTKPKK